MTESAFDANRLRSMSSARSLGAGVASAARVAAPLALRKSRRLWNMVSTASGMKRIGGFNRQDAKVAKRGKRERRENAIKSVALKFSLLSSSSLPPLGDLGVLAVKSPRFLFDQLEFWQHRDRPEEVVEPFGRCGRPEQFLRGGQFGRGGGSAQRDEEQPSGRGFGVLASLVDPLLRALREAGVKCASVCHFEGLECGGEGVSVGDNLLATGPAEGEHQGVVEGERGPDRG